MSGVLGDGLGGGLIFLLGLRHGLDPDHIAIIDNFMDAAETKSATGAAA